MMGIYTICYICYNILQTHDIYEYTSETNLYMFIGLIQRVLMARSVKTMMNYTAIDPDRSGSQRRKSGSKMKVQGYTEVTGSKWDGDRR